MNLFIAIFLFITPILFLLRRSSSKRVPPRSLGIPIIGQSLGFLRAMCTNTAENWLEERVKKYGQVTKVSLFGKPTIFIHGQGANKFIFTNDGTEIVHQQPQSFKMILGSRGSMEVNGKDHKRIRRSALVRFLKPECLKLKQYVVKVDEEVKENIEMYWHGKQHVKVFNINPISKTQE